MAEVKNPIAERVKKMAAILEAAQKVSEELEEEAKEKAEAEKALLALKPAPPPS